MKLAFTAIAAFALAGPAAAALSPDYQRAVEVAAAASAAAEVMAGGGELIESVTFVSDDLYEVTSANCSIAVRIVDIERSADAPAMVGPRQFQAVAEGPVCGE